MAASSQIGYTFSLSFILAISISPLQVLYYSEALPTTARVLHRSFIGVSRRSAQATAGKGLAQGTYVAARAGVEPTTLRLTVIDLTLHHQFHKYTCIYYITLYNTDTPRVN